MYYLLRKVSIEVVIKANNKTGPKILIWSIFDATYFQKWQISFSSSALLKSDKQCKLWAFKMQSLRNPQSKRIKLGLLVDITCPAFFLQKPSPPLQAFIPRLLSRPLFFFFWGQSMKQWWGSRLQTWLSTFTWASHFTPYLLHHNVTNQTSS